MGTASAGIPSMPLDLNLPSTHSVPRHTEAGTAPALRLSIGRLAEHTTHACLAHTVVRYAATASALR
jgi:hypothetical protein